VLSLSLSRYVIANDLSPSAVVAMKRNVDINGLGSPPQIDGLESTGANDEKIVARSRSNEKVKINEGDAWYGVSCPNLFCSCY